MYRALRVIFRRSLIVLMQNTFVIADSLLQCFNIVVQIGIYIFKLHERSLDLLKLERDVSESVIPLVPVFDVF